MLLINNDVTKKGEKFRNCGKCSYWTITFEMFPLLYIGDKALPFSQNKGFSNKWLFIIFIIQRFAKRINTTFDEVYRDSIRTTR